MVLDITDKFYTSGTCLLYTSSNVTDMSNMFYLAGYDKMDSLELGDKFDTSNVTDMSNMFSFAGYDLSLIHI